MNLKWLWKLTRKARNGGKHIPSGALGFRSDDDFAFLFRSSRGHAPLSVQYIVIDGTDTFREWFENFLFMLWGKSRSMIGFDNAAEEFFEQMDPVLNYGSPIVIVGHSRGGGIGQCLAVRIASRIARGGFGDFLTGNAPVSVVTFGSPKGGGRKFRDVFDALGVVHTRVEMVGDPVCKLAPWLKHTNAEHILLKHGLPKRGRKNRQVIHSAYGAFL